ncbi:hypothetical protein HELRODRAFT_168497 [Helobdella robusta]|uniref:peptidylprolyl isomerase n=1 Tax=Helobdella robusta TaxID=6412 RepID=T1F0N0_HELRO|nr:hypothetical protein HELRODRAFT_168497 [Helobdella robusta]ESO09505.1 hypothetical protein HELRODRAFT_168497 [Helobdella robusta]
MDFDLVSPLDFDELKKNQNACFEVPLGNDEDSESEQTTAAVKGSGIDVFGQDFYRDDDLDPDLANPYNYDEIADKCENLTEDGGIKKLLIKRGTGPIVPPTSNVTIMYSAYTEYSDVPFDFTRRPMHMDIGMTTLVGFSKALESMRKGEKASFYIAPQYAFGKLGCPKKIPPNATCLYIIELIDYQEEGGVGAYFDIPSIERHDVAYEVMFSVVKKKRKDAKMSFERKDYEKAGRMYVKCISDLSQYEGTDAVENVLEYNQMLVSLNCNAALCCLKMNEYIPCIRFADAALKLNNKFAKALFIKGKALHKSGDFEGALKLLLEAKKLNPKNKDINEELHYLDRYVEKTKAEEQELCKKIMKGMNVIGSNTSNIKDIKKEDDVRLADDVMKVFVEKLKNLLESDDMSRKLTLTCDTFEPAELNAMSKLAKSMNLNVHGTNRNNELEKIVISKL